MNAAASLLSGSSVIMEMRVSARVRAFVVQWERSFSLFTVVYAIQVASLMGILPLWQPSN